MEWIWLSEEDNSENVEVDIGFVPKMRLTSRSPSAPIILQHGDDTLDRRLALSLHDCVFVRYKLP